MKVLTNKKFKTFAIINGKLYASNEQKCAEYNAVHSFQSKKHKLLNIFVFRIKRNDEDTCDISFSKPCSVCCNMLKAISRKGVKINIKWTTGSSKNLVTPYININDLKNTSPTSGTLKRYNKL